MDKTSQAKHPECKVIVEPASQQDVEKKPDARKPSIDELIQKIDRLHLVWI